MSAKRGTERFSLSRWSRRKLEAAAKPVAPASSAPTPTASPTAARAPTAIATNGPAVPPVAAPATDLPPIESLSFESDFSLFLRPGVDGKLKQAALKKLLRDPHFNVMDGLDTYIDDYTKADPIPPDVLADLVQRFGSTAEMDQSPAVAANVPAENPVAATPVTERAVAEKPATETKVAEIAARDGASGTTPPAAPLQSANISAKRAASVTAEREEERALGHRSEANGNIFRSGEGDRH